MHLVPHRIGRAATALLLALVAVAAVIVVHPTAARADSVQQWYGPYFIKFYGSGKCLDDPGGSATNGTWLDQQTCSSSTNNDKWYLGWYNNLDFQIRNAASHKCANVSGGSYTTGTHIIIYTCGNSYRSEWFAGWGDSGYFPDGYFWISAQANHGYSLAVQNGSVSNGAHFILNTTQHATSEYAAWYYAGSPCSGCS
jgi:hypothetical protein